MFKLLTLSMVIFLIMPIQTLEAHSGNTDTKGCHYDTSTVPPKYHCHKRTKNNYHPAKKESLASRYAVNWIMFLIFIGIIYLVLKEK